MTSAILTPVTSENTTVGETIVPLPPTQQFMADLVENGGVSYHPPSATWYAGTYEAITHSRGRALREMRKAGLICVGASADAQGRVTVRLTVEGRLRHAAR